MKPENGLRATFDSLRGICVELRRPTADQTGRREGFKSLLRKKSFSHIYCSNVSSNFRAPQETHCFASRVVFDIVSTPHNANFVLLAGNLPTPRAACGTGPTKLRSVLKSFWLELRELRLPCLELLIRPKPTPNLSRSLFTAAF